MNRAFALNYQAKTLYEKGADKLVDILQELVDRFDNPDARAALGKLEG